MGVGQDRRSAPTVSVIVPVRDDSRGIDRLLEHLAAQTFPASEFEVVIGDDGSAVPLRPGRNGDVRVVRGGPRTSYDARNRAVAAATGRFLAFTDSDCRPEPSWLERGVEALRGAELAAGEVRFEAPAKPSVWSLLTADMFLDQDRNVRLDRAVTANLFARRDAFEHLGGFDPTLPSGGDYEFAGRAVALGARLTYAPRAVVAHPTLDSGGAFTRKVWNTNRWSGARNARDRIRPTLASAALLLPGIGVALARRQALRPWWRLSRRRLRDAGLNPNPLQHLGAIALIHGFVAFVAVLGRLRGWIDGVRMRRSAHATARSGRRGEATPRAEHGRPG